MIHPLEVFKKNTFESDTFRIGSVVYSASLGNQEHAGAEILFDPIHITQKVMIMNILFIN